MVPKFSEDFRTLPKISEDFPKIFKNPKTQKKRFLNIYEAFRRFSETVGYSFDDFLRLSEDVRRHRLTTLKHNKIGNIQYLVSI